MSFLDSDYLFYLEPVYKPADTASDASINGIIDEGTLLLVDIFGYVHDSASAFGKPPEKVSIGNWVIDAYPFLFSNLPTGKDLRLYWIVNGEVWTVFGDPDGDGVPNSNVFTLGAGSNVDLGLISWYQPYEGTTLVQYDAFGQPGVQARPRNTRIPLMMELPSPIGFNNQQLLKKGMGALFSGWIGGAKTYLEYIVSNTKPGDSREADAARFFLALATLASVASESASDGRSRDINRLGDILDILGIPNDATRGSPSWMDVPEDVDVDDETTERMLTYLDDRITADLDLAAKLLSQVSSSFNIPWTRPDKGTRVENDYADARFFLALLKLEQAYIKIWEAYDLEADIDSVIDSLSDDIPGNDETVEGFLKKNPRFLSIADRQKLKQAGNMLVSGAIDNLELVIKSIQAETDSQEDDLIRLSDLEPDELNRIRDYLAKVKQSVTTGRTLIDTHDSGDRRKDLILDLKQFFTVGVDFRDDNVLPRIVGNDLVGSKPCLPDPTFNGVVISPDLEDILFEETQCDETR
jgi:hypothetical protein